MSNEETKEFLTKKILSSLKEQRRIDSFLTDHQKMLDAWIVKQSMTDKNLKALNDLYLRQYAKQFNEQDYIKEVKEKKKAKKKADKLKNMTKEEKTKAYVKKKYG
jgi:hypothetical protein